MQIPTRRFSSEAIDTENDIPTPLIIVSTTGALGLLLAFYYKKPWLDTFIWTFAGIGMSATGILTYETVK